MVDKDKYSTEIPKKTSQFLMKFIRNNDQCTSNSVIIKDTVVRENLSNNYIDLGKSELKKVDGDRKEGIILTKLVRNGHTLLNSNKVINLKKDALISVEFSLI